MSDESKRTISQQLEFLTKAGVAALGFVYLCGFLVVSVHPSSYGVYSIALLRGQYLTAGVLSLGPLCLTYVVAGLLHTSFESLSFGHLPAPGFLRIKYIFAATWKSLWEVLKVFAVTSAIIDGFASIFVPSARFLLLSHWRAIAWLTLQSLILAMLLLKVWELAGQPNIREKTGIKKTFPFAFLSAVSALLFLGYLGYFARHLYDEIPFAIGGGKPQTVVFLTKSIMPNLRR